jgi:hypothetical protein
MADGWWEKMTEWQLAGNTETDTACFECESRTTTHKAVFAAYEIKNNGLRH